MSSNIEKQTEISLNYKNIIHESFINFHGSVGLYFDDLKGHTIKFNIDNIFNGASCIKLYILIALFKKCQENKIDKNTKIQYKQSHYVDGSGIIQYLSQDLELSLIDTATLMMIISDNIATNMLIDYLSIPYINKIIKELGCEKTQLYSKFCCTEEKPFSAITPRDYYIAWKKLYNNEIFDKETSDNIINIIKNGQYHEMVGDSIDNIYIDSTTSMINYIATKSGKYSWVRNDGGIVSTILGDYICVIFLYSDKDYRYLDDEYFYKQGKKICRLCFDYFLSLHRGSNKEDKDYRIKKKTN